MRTRSRDPTASDDMTPYYDERRKPYGKKA